MAHQHQRPALYDYGAALASLQAKIAELSSLKRQAAVPATRLGATWAFVKANRGSAALLLTMYSISTASVLGAVMAERRLQGDALLEGKEQEALRLEVSRLQRRVEQQQQLLHGWQEDLQQHAGGGAGGGWRPAWAGGGGAAAAAAEATRQAMLDRLQQWDGQAAGGARVASRDGGGGSRARQPGGGGQRQQQQQEFGVRVGPLGRGFLI